MTDFLVSVPRIKQEKVGKFILDAETPSIIDLTTYVINFESQLPKLKGSKAHAISGIVRDIPHPEETSAFVGYPEHGVSKGSDVDPTELEPHYFRPEFLRPMPEAEDDPEFDKDGSYDVSSDVSFCPS